MKIFVTYHRGVEILAQGPVNCHKVLIHRRFYLAHIKEQIIYNDLSEAIAGFKQYACINFFKSSMKPNINY